MFEGKMLYINKKNSGKWDGGHMRVSARGLIFVHYSVGVTKIPYFCDFVGYIPYNNRIFGVDVVEIYF